MPAPLYLALIRDAQDNLILRTYTALSTMQRDDAGKRIVVSWNKRDELRQLIASGKDWPTKTPEDKREDLLNRFDKLTALHGDN